MGRDGVSALLLLLACYAADDPAGADSAAVCVRWRAEMFVKRPVATYSPLKLNAHEVTLSVWPDTDGTEAERRAADKGSVSVSRSHDSIRPALLLYAADP